MADATCALHYDPRTAPSAETWLATPASERVEAVRRWLEANDASLPCTSTSTNEWRIFEDELATGYPPESGRLMTRMVDAGIDRTVAIWALAGASGSQRFMQLTRVARRPGSPLVFGGERLFDERDLSILPAAFEAGCRGVGPAHEAVIEHYRRYYASDEAMNVATAAGFCFGHAAAPGRHRTGKEREAYLFSGDISEEAPFYLPVMEAYGELNEYVLDSLFGQVNPIPPSCRPPERPEACFESAFSDWCRGLTISLEVRTRDWESHLCAHPSLQADYETTVDTLTLFASRRRATAILSRRAAPNESFAAATAKLHASIEAAAPYLYFLAHPVLLGGGKR